VKNKSQLLFQFFLFFVFLSNTLLFTSCNNNQPSDSGEGVFGPSVTSFHSDPIAFRGSGVIDDPHYLIGGPLAQGRVGDVLLQNSNIRVIIQKPRRNAGVALYGGNIIDADVTRPAGQSGQDNFGITFPLINVSWTPFYKRLEILNADFAAGPIVVRATGILDVYDYIQTSIIVPFAKIASSTHATLFFPDQYNDVLNPFQNMPKLRKISTTIVTDYILKSDRSYVIIQTHLFNGGSDKIPIPIGDWINGSGTLETFIPSIGFTGQGRYDQGTPAIIYPGMETNVDVSYGYFFDPTLFTKEDGTINSTDLLTVSGVSIMALGEKIAPSGIIPYGSPGPPVINFSLPPGETTYVRYFAVGKGDAGSVMNAGLEALGVSRYQLSGHVKDMQGAAVTKAKVVVLDSATKKPVTVFYSGANGEFSGEVSAGGTDNKAKMFGSGGYTVEVYKEGYLGSTSWPMTGAPQASLAGKSKAGECSTSAGLNNITCTLGRSGLVQVTAVDENQHPIPARIAIVGFDQSPYQAVPPTNNSDGSKIEEFSILSDIEFGAQQYGYIDTLFLDSQGNITNVGNPRVVNWNTFRLEPGNYGFFVMRGPEYSMHSQFDSVVSGGSVTHVDATLRKVVDTSGYISGDFHIHGINSPDSPFGQQARVNFALAEGLDLMVSADHDAVTDYSQAIQELNVGNLVTSISGIEITPMAFGHFNVFPVEFHAEDPTGGAFDYTKKSGYTPGPSHHELLSPAEFLTMMDAQNSGEQVLQVNHIQDPTLGNFALSKLITTTKFENQGVHALSTYSDPVDFRLSPNTNSGGGFQGPFPYGTNKLFTDKFTAMEICIGESGVVPFPHVRDTALPTWFNFLNLGKQVTATCSSDTHRQIREPIGILRNYIASSVDPRDGRGSFSQVNPQEIAHNVNEHHVIVSAGPFVTIHATSSGQTAQVGDTLTLSGAGPQTVDLRINVQSPDWMDWDTVEIYINTDPEPGNDNTPPTGRWQGTAEEFASVIVDSGQLIHLEPRYMYCPTYSYSRSGTSSPRCTTGNNSFSQMVTNINNPNAKTRWVNLSLPVTLTEDSWIVVLVKGSDNAHTLFPYAPKAVNTQGAELAPTPSGFLSTLANELADTVNHVAPSLPDKIGGSKAFAFTNPIFVDVDGDGWKAKYVRSGQSPLR